MWKLGNGCTSSEVMVMRHFNLKYPPMVKSFLDTDQYKFSMEQCYYHQFNDATAEWAFKSRNAKDYTSEDIEEINKQLNAYCSLVFTKEELRYLASKPWMKKDFMDVLRDWRPHREEIVVSPDEKEGLSIMTHGIQWKITMYEIPILTITAETYYRNHFNYDEMKQAFIDKTLEKLSVHHDDLGKFSEFGTRRRVSFELQEWLVRKLVGHPSFVGTSNLLLAMKLGINAVGTMAHEFIMTVGQGYPKHNPAYSNHYALKAWVKEYGTMNAVALTDTIGTDTFLKDFDSVFATIFVGVRHDSADPFEWGHKMIAHYEKLGIDPKSKVLMFSDSLDFDKASKLTQCFKDKIGVAFGIGTYLTGAQDVEPLNIVCKVVKVNGLDVAKLSDCEGKNMCRNPEAIEFLKRTIAMRE